MREALRVLWLIVGLSAVSRSSHAGDEAVADALYRDGQRLIAEGKVHDACLKFAESERLDPATGTLIATAACHEKEGKLATALAEFNDAVAMAQRAHETAREQYARSHAATIDKSVYRVTVNVASPPAGLELSLDTRVLGVGALGSAIPLDAGRHHIEVSAPGRATWTKDVDALSTGGHAELTVSLEEAPVAGASVSLFGAQSLVPAMAVGGSGAALLVAGAVMVAVGTVQGNDAVSSADLAKAEQNEIAYANAQSSRSSAVDVQTAGFVVGGAGIAAAAVGIWLYVRARSASAPHPATGRIVPNVFPLFPRGEGVGVGGTF